MKSVLISIRPKWCEKIASGEKTIEVRKTAPKEVPFKAYIYCTKGKDGYEWLYRVDNNGYGKAQSWHGKVIGEFICDKVYNLVNASGGIVFADENLNQLEPQLFRDMSCLTDEQTADYLGNKDGYGLHITDLKIYDKPKELRDFFVYKKVKGGCENCAYYRTPTLEFCQDCKSGKQPKKYLTRPPQSWCYVEELCKAQN